MLCPICKIKTRVLRTRKPTSDRVRRYHECTVCGRRWVSEERIIKTLSEQK